MDTGTILANMTPSERAQYESEVRDRVACLWVRGQCGDLRLPQAAVDACPDRRAFRALVNERLQELYQNALTWWDERHPEDGPGNA